MTTKEVQEITRRNAFVRTIHYNDDAALISGRIQSVTWSIESLTVSLGPMNIVFS